MPTRPTASDLHVDEVLMGFATTYGQDLAKDFVSDTACTVVKVDSPSDIYAVWNKADIFRSVMETRADGVEAVEGGFAVDLTNTYKVEVYALATKVTKRMEKSGGGRLKIREKKVKWLMGQAKLKRDIVFGAKAFVTGIWDREQTGVSGSPSTDEFKQFNDSASVPLTVFDAEQAYIQSQTGKLHNVAVMPLDVAQKLQRHADIVDLYKHTEPGPVAMELVAKAIGVDAIRVANAIQNTGPQNGTTAMARVFGKHILLVHVEEGMSDEEPTALGLFSWNEIDQVTAEGAAIRTWFDNGKKCDYLEAEQAFDIQITANDMGAFLLSAIA